MQNKPKVLWVYTINPGVTFYRMYQFMNKMSELDLVHSRLYPDWNPARLTSPIWEQNLFKDLSFWEDMMNWADLVITQYIASPEGVSLTYGINKFKPCLMELDDVVSAVPNTSISYAYNKPGEQQDYWAVRQMMEASGIVCSTRYLADYYQKYNEKVHVIPNCIDFDLWDKYPSKSHDNVRIGWIGGATHASDLKMVKTVLYDILDTYKNVEVFIVSSPPPLWEPKERLHLIDKWTRIDKYPEYVKSLSFDIGLAPLRDNTFNRGKSNLRFLEYGSMGIPVVASDVIPFMDTPAFLARDDSEWYAYLSDLIEDEEMRTSKGEENRSFVEEYFNLNKIALNYANLIKEILEWRGQMSLVQQVHGRV